MRKERVIYDNYNLDEMWDDAKESILENTGDANPSDQEIWDEISWYDGNYWDEAKEEMKRVFDNGKFLAVGTCGLWNGNFAGGFIFDSFDELMEHFRDCEYFKFWDENGHFYMKGTHHDGTHIVEIKRITKKGEDYYWNWDMYCIPNDNRSKQEVHKKMFKDSHYTNLINYANKVWGCPRRENA